MPRSRTGKPASLADQNQVASFCSAAAEFLVSSIFTVAYETRHGQRPVAMEVAKLSLYALLRIPPSTMNMRAFGGMSQPSCKNNHWYLALQLFTALKCTRHMRQQEKHERSCLFLLFPPRCCLPVIGRVTQGREQLAGDQRGCGRPHLARIRSCEHEHNRRPLPKLWDSHFTGLLAPLQRLPADVDSLAPYQKVSAARSHYQGGC